MPAKRVKPSEVAAAYGETVVDDEPAEEKITSPSDCTGHEVANSVKGMYQYLYGNPVVCKNCGARLKLIWVEA